MPTRKLVGCFLLLGACAERGSANEASVPLDTSTSESSVDATVQETASTDTSADTASPEAASPEVGTDASVDTAPTDAPLVDAPAEVVDGACARGPLRFAPPALVNPYVITNVDPDRDRDFPRPGSGDPTVGFTIGNFFPPDRDIVLRLPRDRVLTRGITIRGGRNVRVIGGEFRLSGGGFDRDDAGTPYPSHAIRLEGGGRSFFVEGTRIDTNRRASDAFVILPRNTAEVSWAAPFDVTLQNVYVNGIVNTVVPLPDGGTMEVHGDMVQNQAPVDPPDGGPRYAFGTLRIERMTGRSSCQGLFIPSRGPVGGFEFHEVDLSYEADTPGGTALLWLRDAITQRPNPGSFDEFYVGQHPLYRPFYEVAVWPRSTSSTYMPAAFRWTEWGTTPLDGGTAISFHAENRITGVVHLGPPACGSFVDPATVGLAYRSPHGEP